MSSPLLALTQFPISTFLNSFRHLIDFEHRYRLMSTTANWRISFDLDPPFLLNLPVIKFLLRHPINPSHLTFKFLVTEFNKNRHIFIIFTKKTRKLKFKVRDQNSTSPAILLPSISKGNCFVPFDVLNIPL